MEAIHNEQVELRKTPWFHHLILVFLKVRSDLTPGAVQRKRRKRLHESQNGTREADG
jgi:hypothetical protein